MALKLTNLRFVSSQNIDHDLHDSLVHAQYSHQIRMLVEYFIVHDVPGKEKKDQQYRLSSSLF